MSMQSLPEGYRALVIGASGAIGAAIAAQLRADPRCGKVLALSRSFDAIELIEDELLLSLPLVPRHEVCPVPLPRPVDDLSHAEGDERPNPFAALAALKKSLGPAQ